MRSWRLLFASSSNELMSETGKEKKKPPPPIYLVVEHEQDGAANTHITWPLHLETISLLGGGSPVPLK